MEFIKSLISCTFVIMFHEFNSMANSREDLIQKVTYQLKMTNILLEQANNNPYLKDTFIMILNDYVLKKHEPHTWAEILFPCRGYRIQYETDENLKRRLEMEKSFRSNLFINSHNQDVYMINEILNYPNEVEKRYALIKALVENMLTENFHETKLCENGFVEKCALKAYLDYIQNPLIYDQFVYCKNSVCTVEHYAMKTGTEILLLYDPKFCTKYTIQDSAQDVEIMSQHLHHIKI
ncbi:uncharacterized protein LOC126904844 isoform X2 [Daktulosphaira vitifoliae]|uniref:uncharacterized protein LOC126904844 isoform X2 n=1 Tax=Daktulosphaira vitifoliae TaxID=58002 RepID=UPI0021A98B59|nr:uncharacterized protein LOC126904844 isoform X2 [Daktulosphaira vitifoliae]